MTRSSSITFALKRISREHSTILNGGGIGVLSQSVAEHDDEQVVPIVDGNVVDSMVLKWMLD